MMKYSWYIYWLILKETFKEWLRFQFTRKQSGIDWNEEIEHKREKRRDE